VKHGTGRRRDRRLPQSFYARDALSVAIDLLGKRLRRDSVVLRITETEAYCWPDDSACHNRFGRTARTEVMFGPPGHAYVYLCYGLHSMLNIVTNPPGEAAAVLIRACEPIAGEAVIRRRRGGLDGPVLLTGPGKIGAALGLDVRWSGHPLFTAGGLELLDGDAPSEVLHGPRVGIDYARPEHRDALWRFAIGGTRWVSAPKTLRSRG
jgi:DNA-3-methyladenine glycosylase